MANEVKNKLLNFDFISDEGFRASLVNDYREMKSCEDAECWKAVYVLAGSMVEALLIEYLVISGIAPGGKDPLSIDLAVAIHACTTDGVLGKDTASLCEVIREYRNLIHPGRVKRLNQNISQEGAVIASNLVSLISREIAVRRKLKYGPTAEQIASKLREDQHSLALLPELLAETKVHEKMKLVDSLIPEAYKEEVSFIPNDAILERYKVSYRQILDALPALNQATIAKKFADSVRRDSDQQIQAFGDVFFSARDIAHLELKDAGVVVTHLLARLADPNTEITKDFVGSLVGIGKFIPSGSGANFGNLLIKLSLRKTLDGVKVAEFVTTEFDNVQNQTDKDAMSRRALVWITYAEEKSFSKHLIARLETISSSWSDIPF